MIEFEKLIYLDVYKTGSTHVLDMLKKISTGKPVRIVRHAALTEGRRFSWKGGKFVFATIRNPWDWYVSLWAFGFSKEKAFYQNILKAVGEKRTEELYDRTQPGKAFPLWLKSVHDPDFLNKAMSHSNLASSGLASVMGFYSYRFMRITTPYPQIFLRRWNIASIDRAIAYQRKWAMYDEMYRSEDLDARLVTLASERGESLGFRPNAVRILKRNEEQHRNTSIRTLASYRDYYTDDLVELVGRRDRLIVDLFGYTF